MSQPCLVAVDIGNARTKLGLFGDGSAAGIPEPVRTLPLWDDAPESDQISPWLADDGRQPLRWWIASVNRPAATRLIDWLGEHRRQDRITLLASGDLPLVIHLERPDMVGIDRLVDAVAANRLRQADRAAVIVNVGTAITVDLVSADGAFRGGAILPGIQMSARALHEFTDLLPLVDVAELIVPPPALGTGTVPAMKSGLFWGAVGAIRQLIDELCKAAPGGRAGQPHVFLTGGAAEGVAELLGAEARYVPNLTLAGIALTAWEPAPMKVAHFTGPKKLEIFDLPRPKLHRPDAVLLKIDRVGVCGSDVHYYTDGRIGDQVLAYPATLGHECAGTVVEVGAEVAHLRPANAWRSIRPWFAAPATSAARDERTPAATCSSWAPRARRWAPWPSIASCQRRTVSPFPSR